ncbi:hypothetical protein RhiirC2_847186 [Rhizophagus irregularis]|uniref:Uncharacterized protein n=1 Tax=Rhizophagus irregularis TaxID=588596 RepID=A0A2N1NJ84_9GLOM|nr:hypothetical protein RhiirC2_847186 [Rhizophagus irregularis]
MSQNTFQDNQNVPAFTECNNLQSTIIQPRHSSNINYNDVNDNSSDNNNFPTIYTDTNYSDQQPIFNDNITSTLPPWYKIIVIPFPLNSFNMNSNNPPQSEILSFDIPGYKIIVIPTFSQQDNTCLNYSSSDIKNTQFTQFQQ